MKHTLYSTHYSRCLYRHITIQKGKKMLKTVNGYIKIRNEREKEREGREKGECVMKSNIGLLLDIGVLVKLECQLLS